MSKVFLFLFYMFIIIQDHTRVMQYHTRVIQDFKRVIQGLNNILQYHTRSNKGYTIQGHTKVIQGHTRVIKDICIYNPVFYSFHFPNIFRLVFSLQVLECLFLFLF